MPDAAATPKSRMMNVADALREATQICLENDPAVYVMGEGVTDPKGIFGTTLGLVQRFGPDRVIEMPIAENGMTGIAIGSAVLGQRPIMIHQRVDFALLALEQIVNNAAKFHYVTAGQHRVPMVIRMIIGRGWGQGPAHSQALENMFAMVPGLKVCMPTTAAEAKGQMIAAVEDDNPVMMIEHRWVHYAQGEVPEGHYTTPLVGSRVVREGSDITLVATSYALFEALLAAETLAQADVSVEVIDLAMLRPLNMAPILASVAKTGRLITVDTGFRTLGMGSEIITQVVEQGFGSLRAAPVRLGLPDHPTPSSRELVRDYYPVSLDIFDTVAQLVDVPTERGAAPRAGLEAEREKIPFDVPYPAFRGPF